MIRKPFHILIILTILLGFSQVSAQAPSLGPYKGTEEPTGKVSGKVIDAGKSFPLEYATIGIIRSADSVMVTGGVTDTKGNFSIQKVPNGKYYLRIHFMGYKKFRSADFIISPKSTSYEAGIVKLSSASKSLQQVEVDLGREALPQQVIGLRIQIHGPQRSSVRQQALRQHTRAGADLQQARRLR